MTRAELIAEIERYALVCARFARAEATDRQYANARVRIEKAVAAAVAR